MRVLIFRKYDLIRISVLFGTSLCYNRFLLAYSRYFGKIQEVVGRTNNLLSFDGHGRQNEKVSENRAK